MKGAADILGFQAQYQPNRLAAIDLPRNREWTYLELDNTTARFASALKSYDVNTGDRIVCLANNRVELVALHLACARIGAIYVPLNWRLTAPEINSLLEDIEPKLILGDDLLHKFSLQGLDIELFLEKAQELEPFPYQIIDTQLPSLMLFTSGTSGRPKGALLSENNIAETGINFGYLARVNNKSVMMCDAPMFHIIGLITSVRPPLMQGGTFVVSDGFEPERTLNRLADPKLAISHYFCVPVMADLMRADPSYSPDKLKGLTGLFSGGAPVAEAKIQNWVEDGVPFVNGFGMSEAGTIFGMPADIDLIAKRPGSAGITTSRVSARLVNADGNLCETGEAGEIQLKGANLCSGYWRCPEESAAIFTEDGWFQTGDVARCDDDGYYWIVDRIKDMFISGGENVYPGEIENLLAHNSAIKECAVVGQADEKWGEVGHLFVVLTDSSEASNSSLDGEALIKSLDGKLARYKLPKYVTFIKSLPRNANGKILKTALLEQLKK